MRSQDTSTRPKGVSRCARAQNTGPPVSGATRTRRYPGSSGAIPPRRRNNQSSTQPRAQWLKLMAPTVPSGATAAQDSQIVVAPSATS